MVSLIYLNRKPMNHSHTLRSIYSTVFLLFCFVASYSQSTLRIKVEHADHHSPLEAVSIAVNGRDMAITGKDGMALLTLATGRYALRLSSVGFQTTDTIVPIPFSDTLLIRLVPSATTLGEVTVLSSTRNNQRIENAPIKVEVLGREEMEEESSIKPAGIASILGDISGVQIQQSSAVSGNANIRIQGLDGRYTQILKDGLPLYDGFSGGFGILSIPPLDLKQVELIKGSSSTLYGGGAIGGLVNIISRTPGQKQEAVLNLNQTTLKETNLNTYLSKKYKKAGYTFYAGYNFQKAVDVNNDGLSDVSDWKGWVVHPRLFFYPDDKTTIVAGYTGTFEKRNGGDMMVLDGKPDAVHQFFENNRIHRNSLELSMKRNLAPHSRIEWKNSVSLFKRTITGNEPDFTGRQLNYYSEISLQAHNLIAGVNATGDRFTTLSQPLLLKDFHNNTIGAFVQQTWYLREETLLEFGLRNDYHFTYGNFLLPRVSFFHRFNEQWATRWGVGFGYKTPNALAPQNIDIPIRQIQSLPETARSEKSVGYNAEVNYTFRWDEDHELFINHAFFLTQLRHPLVATLLPNDEYTFINQDRSVLTYGYDTYISAVINGFELYAGYTFTIAERKYLPDHSFLPLTPRNRMAFTLVKNWEEPALRLGIEGSYTGSQHRLDYTSTPGFFFLAAMIEKKWNRHFSTVLNGENLLDFRQSRKEALYSGSITHPVFNALWAPIDGRVLNLSVKFKW